MNKYKNCFTNIKKYKNNSYFKLNKTKNSNIKLIKFECDGEFRENKEFKVNNFKNFKKSNSFFNLK